MVMAMMWKLILLRLTETLLGGRGIGDVTWACSNGSIKSRRIRVIQQLDLYQKDISGSTMAARSYGSRFSWFVRRCFWKGWSIQVVNKLFRRCPSCSIPLCKQQNMHPNMYDGQRGSERLRCSERLLSAKDSFKKARIGSESLSSDSRSSEYPADKHSDSMVYSVALWGNYQCRKRIPLGPLFQANIPEFTGKTNEIDSTWLGTRIWPLEKCENKGVLIERDRIGKGRQDSCGCEFPGSVECVKFHVSQKSSRLKLELCSAFEGWKFDSMGEKVAICWTKEEQNRFQDMLKLNPLSQDKYFWDELLKLLPRKDKEALLSYYFNVFLLRRRGYQNRISPSNVDSDEE
ncbi:Hypothetical predicted protein [Olea europaea subsp. europaea]|uniref:ELM2 domain-containing protein n=1 Tax=Olea europaea subsp. europaea TaxID=158383 RepID=A0A8S0TK30_OLEEU|nr:Hypothetical predicted protein [Olea europaea subsp. europaea]